MRTAMDILKDKGGSVYCTTPQTKVIDAIHTMNRHRIGALVVMDGECVCGIFTERDVLARVAGERIDPQDVNVGEVMTREVAACRPDQRLDEIAAIMQQQRVRHLPVVGESGELHGLISIGDVNACHASEQDQQIHFLSDYIYGRV
jgi:CBS domain-containing protein